MAKILIIERCSQCIYISWNTYDTPLGSYSKPFCLKENKEFKSEYEIPSWCPLDDAPKLKTKSDYWRELNDAPSTKDGA